MPAYIGRLKLLYRLKEVAPHELQSTAQRDSFICRHQHVYATVALHLTQQSSFDKTLKGMAICFFQYLANEQLLNGVLKLKEPEHVWGHGISESVTTLGLKSNYQAVRENPHEHYRYPFTPLRTYDEPPLALRLGRSLVEEIDAKELSEEPWGKWTYDDITLNADALALTGRPDELTAIEALRELPNHYTSAVTKAVAETTQRQESRILLESFQKSEGDAKAAVEKLKANPELLQVTSTQLLTQIKLLESNRAPRNVILPLKNGCVHLVLLSKITTDFLKVSQFEQGFPLVKLFLMSSQTLVENINQVLAARQGKHVTDHDFMRDEALGLLKSIDAEEREILEWMNVLTGTRYPFFYFWNTPAICVTPYMQTLSDYYGITASRVMYGTEFSPQTLKLADPNAVLRDVGKMLNDVSGVVLKLVQTHCLSE